MTFAEAERGFLRHLLDKGTRRTTAQAYQIDLEVFRRFLVVHRPETHVPSLFVDRTEPAVDIALVNKSDIDAFIRYLVEDRANGDRTVMRKSSSLKSFFRYLHRSRIIPANPCEIEFTAVLPPTPAPRLSASVANTFLESVRDVGDWAAMRDYAMFLIVLSMGLTVSELVALNRSDFSETDMLDRFSEVDVSRSIPIPHRAKTAVEDYLKALAASAIEVRNHSALFISNKGGRITPWGVRYTLSKRVSAFRANGAALAMKVSPQVLRRSLIVALLENNADLGAVKALLGHNAVASTAAYVPISRERSADTLSANPFADGASL